ncbi:MULTISPECIES: STAS domain-containing protein [unclassified Streptomyces]|uniref:STAS domain-containing protein n=2 Tax=unclassified Streptomyces TaxID=2593676 RepID=UPI0033B0CDAC
MFSNCQERPASPPHRRGCPGNRPTTSSGIRPFCIHVTRMHSGRVVLAVTGAVDRATAGALRATALEEIAAGARKLVLDFSYLSFWDSSGMGAVASAYRSASHVGASVALAGLSPTLERTFRLTGMDRVVPLHRDVCTALTA